MKQNRLAILIIILIVILIGGFFILNPEASQEFLVELGLAEPPLEKYSASGLLETKKAIISSLTGGRVEFVYVSEGQSINAGDKLLSFDPELVELQMHLVQAEISGLEAQLALLENTPRQVDLNVLDKAIKLSEISLENAEQALEDFEETGFEDIDEINQDLLKSRISETQADLNKTLAEKDMVENAVQESDLDQIETAITIKNIEYMQLEDLLAKHTIYAVSDGLVSDITIKPGEIALPGLPLLKIASTNALELSVYIPEADLNWVEIDQKVEFRIDAYPNTIFIGKVITINNSAEFTPRNVQTPEERTILVYKVVIIVTSSDDRLKPGIPADAIFEVQQ